MSKVSRTRRFGTIMLAAAMSAGTMGLAACAQPETTEETKAATQASTDALPSADEIIQRLQETSGDFNGRMSGDMAITMAVPTGDDAQATDALTIDAMFEFDVKGEKAHGTMSIPMATLTGESGQDMKAEMYVENDTASGNATTYMTYDGKSWNKVEMPIGQSMSDTPETLTETLTGDGVTVARHGDGYRLTLDAEATQRMSQGIPNATGMSGDISQMPVNEKAQATIDVDKDMRLEAIHVETGTDDTTTEGNANALSSFTMGVTLDLRFSDVGKVTDADVDVPSAVKDAATDTTSATEEKAGADSKATTTAGANAVTEENLATE